MILIPCETSNLKRKIVNKMIIWLSSIFDSILMALQKDSKMSY